MCFAAKSVTNLEMLLIETEDKYGVAVYIGLWYLFNIGERLNLAQPATKLALALRVTCQPLRIQHLQQEGVVVWLQPRVGKWWCTKKKHF